MKTILIYSSKQPFVQNDINILECDEYKVITNKKGYLSELIFFIKNRYDKYYIWFNDIHALIPVIIAKLTFRKSIIFAGGYDAVYIPELNYGALNGSFRSKIIKLIYKLADRVVVPSLDLYSKLKIHIRKDIEIIHSSINTQFWKPEKLERVYDFVTVGNIKDSNTFYRKGIDKFFHSASEHPDKKFVLIGNFSNELQKPRLHNLTITGYLDVEYLKFFLNKSIHYCQLSRYESFGYALIEAMSMGCIPIVNDAGIMKFIAGDVKTTEQARQRVIELFSNQLRKQKILEL